MRIPENTLRTSHIRTYGSAGLPQEDMSEQGGCPMVYKRKYVEYSLKEPRSFPLEYGTLIHDALYLMEEEGLPLLPDALDKAWGRTEAPLDALAYQEAVDDFEKYMERRSDNLMTVAVEQELKMPLMEYNDQEWFFGGRLDKIEIDPTDPTTLYVRDYKTNRSPPSQRQVDEDPQFTGYLLLVKHNAHLWLPDVDPADVRVVGIMDAIKWYELFTERAPWQFESYEDFLRAMVRRIADDEEGLPVLNESCSWCPLKYDCPEFRKLPGKGETLRDRISIKTDLVDRVHLMQQAEVTMKGLKAVIDEVKAELKEEAEHGRPHTVNGVVYDVTDQFETVIDLPALHEVMGSEFYNVVNPVQTRISEWVKRNREMESAVEGVQQRMSKGSKRLTAKKAEDGF